MTYLWIFVVSKDYWHRPSHINGCSETCILEISTIAASDLFLELENVRPFVMPMNALARESHGDD
jgi:hypothetical protein